MAEKTLDTLSHDTLNDIYYAERNIMKSLPKMARAAQSPGLNAAFEKHKDQTEGQIERLQKVFEIIGKPARGKTCDAIEGILAEGDEIAEEYKGTPALDAGLLAAAQAVEHYEITRYGTLKRWALVLGLKDAAALRRDPAGRVPDRRGPDDPRRRGHQRRSGPARRLSSEAPRSEPAALQVAGFFVTASRRLPPMAMAHPGIAEEK